MDQFASRLNIDPISLNMPESSPPQNTQTYVRKMQGKRCQKNLNDSQHLARRATRSNLPKHATAILKSWLESHWNYPYPTEEEKDSLARSTGIELEQINNWLINARRRLLPDICRKNGLDYNECKIARRSGNKRLVQEPTEEIQPCSYDSHGSSSESWVAVGGSNIVYRNYPDLRDFPIELHYLRDVIVGLENYPRDEGLSRKEFLCRMGLGNCVYPDSA